MYTCIKNKPLRHWKKKMKETHKGKKIPIIMNKYK